MKKFFLTIIFILILASAGFFVLQNSAQTITEEKTEEPETVALCYQYNNEIYNGYYDKARLWMSITGDKVTGRFENLPSETDSKVGDFEGTVTPLIPEIMGRRANVWYEAYAEGTLVTEEFFIEFGEGSAAPLYKEMIDRGDGVYIYKEGSPEYWGPTMSQVACEDLAEVKLVEDYLRDNISEVANVAGDSEVLGGYWYVNSIFVNHATNNGRVFYEDGHIRSGANFDYKIDPETNSVTILNFNTIIE